MELKTKLDNTVAAIIDMVDSSGVMQEEFTATGEALVFDGMLELIRESAGEGMVLLKNDGTLPLKKEQTVAVFGRCQYDYFYVGYGSGGDVNAPYFVSPIDGLQNAGVALNEELATLYRDWCAANPVSHGFWGHWPMYYPEMPIGKALINKVSLQSDVALVILGRAAGEDRENKLEKGSYYLTDAERQLLDDVTECFDRVAVVLDCGNIIDMSWTEAYGGKIGAILYAWQCGMESGNALADVLTGRVNPSGKLADTIARHYEDYPSANNFGGTQFNVYQEDIFVGYRYFETFQKDSVLYPFGFGLSYTTFNITPESLTLDGDVFTAAVTVKNTGAAAGKEAVQLYVQKPMGALSQAARSLVAFAKTKCLAPGEEETLTLTFTLYDLSSYDEHGVTGHKSSYVLEAGDYLFYAGGNVRDTAAFDAVTLPFTVTDTVQTACAPREEFEVIVPRQHGDTVIPVKTPVHPAQPYLKERILGRLPEETAYKANTGETLQDVIDGKLTLQEFVATLTSTELEVLSRGQGYMNSELGIEGNAGAYGGTCESLMEKGVKPIITTDGPAGIRIKRYTSLVPCGTALACTMNTQLIERLAVQFGQEMLFRETDVILAPGMNIHRDVLCGRNFEYFSEDPVISGKMASAYVRGIQRSGKAACPKHFACNNQETKRTVTDSRLTERALREIYLKGFELCVREAKPLNIMTSYNKINGVWSHYNYDLVQTVLRDEWGFEGCVITDWWMQKSKSPEFPTLRDNAYRVRSHVNVLMPGGKQTDKKYKSDGTLLETFGQPDGIRRSELEQNAMVVLKLIMKLKY